MSRACDLNVSNKFHARYRRVEYASNEFGARFRHVSVRHQNLSKWRCHSAYFRLKSTLVENDGGLNSNICEKKQWPMY